jgi:hypothetical protein
MPAHLRQRACLPVIVGLLMILPSTALEGLRPGGQVNATAPLLDVSETLLARLDANADRERIIVDRRTARRAVWVSKQGKTERVFVDGTPGPAFEKIEFNAATFSPDSSRFAYWGKRDKWFAVLDGQEYGPYDIQRQIQFSGDSRIALWYGCKSRNRCFRVINGLEGAPVGWQMKDRFSRDGSTLAYAESAKDGERQGARIIVGEEKGPLFQLVGTPHLSADGRHVAYWAKEEKEKTLRLIVDGKALPGVEGGSPDHLDALDRILSIYDLPFAPDEQHLAYVIERDDKLLPVMFGKTGPPCDWFGGLAFDPSFSRSAYVVTNEAGFSKALRQMATWATNGVERFNPVSTKTRLVLDGVDHPEIGKPTAPPVFSPDGKRLAVALEKTFVVDAQPGAVYDAVAGEAVAFSPDSRRIAYVVKQDNKWRVVVDGVPGRAYKLLHALTAYGGRALSFSPDSRHVLYQAETDMGRIVVVDPGGGTTPAYDQVSNIVVFEAPGTATIVALRGDRLLRGVVTLPAGTP